MNNSNNPFLKKRSNPFAVERHEEVEEVVEKEPEAPKKVETIVEEVKKTEPVTENVVEEVVQVVKPVARNQSSQTKNSPRTPKARYVQQDELGRQKYTATMDENLRRRIKITCARRGIMFSQFIEDACREKLNREGE